MIHIVLLMLMGCAAIPEISKDVEDIATDTAIKIEVSRELIIQKKDLSIDIQVLGEKG
jgi:starvation-inducible outer membrane lipoprotein